jgi:hypothetical protein
MTEEELSAIVEAKLADRLAARLEADRQRIRAEVVDGLRREETRAHYERINARAPIEGPLAGLTPEQHRARLAAMDARARADNEAMDRANSRVIEGSLLDQRKRAALTPGSEGFEIRPAGRRL